MRKILYIILAFFSSFTYADSLILTDAEIQKLNQYFPVTDNLHETWKGDPISISLPLGKEKRLIFHGHVNVDVKGMLSTDQLRLINNNKSLYLTALRPFLSTRIYVTLQESNEVILIDLTVKQDANNQTQYIDIKKDNIIETATNQSPDVITSNATPTYVDLMRFAWQQTYAPERLLKNIEQYNRTPMHTQPFVSDLIYGDKVIAHPDASWSIGNYYVTVISLQNKYKHVTKINSSHDICGVWQAATIYPRSILQPHGQRMADSATLFLVSRKSFGEALGVCHGDA